MKNPKITCNGCGIELNPVVEEEVDTEFIYCSKECYDLDTYIKVKVRQNIKSIVIDCLECDKQHEYVIPHKHKFCSKECRKNHAKNNKKDFNFFSLMTRLAKRTIT